MVVCLNPACPKPHNPSNNQYCYGCGNPLSSQEYTFDHYKVTKLLGEGGFGRTYLAQDLRLYNRPCVIKKLIASASGANVQQKILELFAREGKQLFELDHPQIPKLYSYFDLDNSLYLIQEYIEGTSLIQEWEQQGNFSEETIKNILIDLLPVLEYIQSKDVLHRDIKPDNIMRRHSDNKLILIDFGAARVKTATDPGTLTAIYTPGYAAPEHIRGRPNQASDIYSLGVTCVRLLTGVFPTGTTDLIYDDYNGCWCWRLYLQKQGKKINPQLADILDKMLGLTLATRYNNAQEVLKDLIPITHSSPTNKQVSHPTVEVQQNQQNPELVLHKQLKQQKAQIQGYENKINTLQQTIHNLQINQSQLAPTPKKNTVKWLVGLFLLSIIGFIAYTYHLDQLYYLESRISRETRAKNDLEEKLEQQGQILSNIRSNVDSRNYNNGSSRTSVKLCNETNKKIYTAFVYWESENGWSSRGWYNIDPDQCNQVFASSNYKEKFYIIANHQTWQLETESFCLEHPGPFNIADSDTVSCDKKGQKKVKMIDFPILPGENIYTFK